MDIKNSLKKKLSGSDRAVALELADHLAEAGAEFFHDKNGSWRDKDYFWVMYGGRSIGYISIMNPDEPENRWTVWSGDIGDVESGPSGLEADAWKYVDRCRGCGSCGGGRRRVIFGKEFPDVCGCTFRLDNPGAGDLPFLKFLFDREMG